MHSYSVLSSAHRVLKEWDTLAWQDGVTLFFRKIKIKTYQLFEWTAFLVTFIENLYVIIKFRMNMSKQLNTGHIASCSNEQLSQVYETRDNIYFSNSIIKQHTTYIIVWQLPISLCHGSNSLKGSEQPYESVQTALSRTAPHICEFFNSFQM